MIYDKYESIVINVNSDKYMLNIYTIYANYDEHGIDSILFKVRGNNGGSIDIKFYNLYNECKSTNYACIDNITSDDSSELKDNLDSCEKTLNMVYSALHCIIKLCPWITHFKLNDIQRKYCIRGQPTPGMNLSCFYLALYGKTWYEKYLYAKLERDSDYDKYVKCIDTFNNQDNTMYKWDEFISYLHGVLYKETFMAIDLELIKFCYETTTTFVEFFKKIKKQIILIGDYKYNIVHKLYNTIEHWVDNCFFWFIFESNLDILRQTWIFESINIPIVNYYIEPIEFNEFSDTKPTGYKIM